MKQGVFIKQSFTPEQTKRLEESSGPSQYITDWLSDDEFSLLRSIALDPKITYPEIGRVSKYWDHNALHTADDFPGHGIRTKRCFMIFTYLL